MSDDSGKASRWRLSNYGLVGRAAIIMALLAGTSAVGVGAVTVMENLSATALATGGYPDWDKPCVAAGEAHGKTTGTGYWCDGYQWGDPGTGNQTSSRHYSYRNCTDWVAFRIPQLVHVPVPARLGDAKFWDNNAPSSWHIDPTPEPGDIAQSEGPADDNFGHLGVVEKVNGNSGGQVISIEVSEYNGHSDGNYTYRTYSPDANGTYWRYREAKREAKWDHFLNVGGGGDSGVPPKQNPPSPPGGQGKSAVVTLAQGPTAPSGYRYAITLNNFPPNTNVSVKCYDSVTPSGFYPFTMHTDGNGYASIANQCYSGDGPDHWVKVNGLESNHVTWTKNSGPGPIPRPFQDRFAVGCR